jgi:hypothetical protein
MTNSFAAGEFTEKALLDEGGILPVQFYQARAGAGEGEAIRRLMTAILVDGVHCYQAGARLGWKGQEGSEARLWIFGDYAEFPFSFGNVCAELGISPERLRERLPLDEERIACGGRPRLVRRPAVFRGGRYAGVE